MRALFLIDNIPILEMFLPIIAKLPSGWQTKLVSYNGSVIDGCEPLKSEDARGVEGIIARETPDIIVMAREETNAVEHNFAISGIPTLLVPHGALMPNEKKLWFGNGRFVRVKHSLKLLKQAYGKVKRGDMPLGRLLRTGLFRARHDFRNGTTLSRYDNYSKVAAYGDAMRDILVGYGANPDNIVVTGNPKYHKYLDIKSHNSGKVLLITDYLVDFGLWSKGKRLNYLKDVCGMVSELTARNLELLIHPVLEDKTEYERLVAKHGLAANVYQMELTKLIDECDVAITLLSTSGLEVMVAGKPLVIYNPYSDPTMYDENAGVYIVRTKGELAETVRQLLCCGLDEDHRKLATAFVYRQTYLRDGKADERIADLVINITGGE